MGSAIIVFDVIGLVCTFLSIVSCTLLLLLSTLSTARNGMLRVIWFMIIFELVFDCGCFMTFAFGSYDTVYYIAFSFQIIGGITTSILSNFLAYVIVYIINNRTVFDIGKFIFHMVGLSLLPSLTTFFVFTAGYVTNSELLTAVAILYMNYYIRLASIIANVLCAFYTYCKLRSIIDTKSILNRAIITLVTRLFYYPLVQVVARSGPGVQRMLYGMGGPEDDSISSGYAILLFYEALTAPSAGIFFLLIYLYTQPNAWKEFESTFPCLKRCTKARAPLNAPLIDPEDVNESLQRTTEPRSISELARDRLNESSSERNGVESTTRDSGSTNTSEASDLSLYRRFTRMSASAAYFLSAGVPVPTHKSMKSVPSAYSSRHNSYLRSPSSTPFSDASNGSQRNDQTSAESSSGHSGRSNILSVASESTSATDVVLECEGKTAEELTQMIVRLSEEELSMTQANTPAAYCNTTYNAEYTANSPLGHTELEL